MKKYNNLTEQSKYDALAEQYRELAIKYAITMQGLKKIKMGSCRIITINNMGNILEYLEIHTTWGSDLKINNFKSADLLKVAKDLEYNYDNKK